MPVTYLAKNDGNDGKSLPPKGQLISKCPYEKSVLSKYQRKNFRDFCPSL